MQTAIERVHREGATVCTFVRAEGHIRRSMYPACWPTVQGRALGLCQDGWHWPQS